MGWFGCGPMDGDEAMDCRDEVFGFLDLGDRHEMEIIHPDYDKFVRETLESKQNLVYDLFREYDWGTHNPGFKQTVWAQALAQLMCSYGARINKRGLKAFLMFIETDKWAEENDERKDEMEKLKQNVLDNLLPEVA
jgi:hypothetical protein